MGNTSDYEFRNCGNVASDIVISFAGCVQRTENIQSKDDSFLFC